MKRVCTVSLFCLLICVISSFTQAEERPYLRAKIPFAFDIGNVHLPAGSYLFLLVIPYNDVVEVRNESTLRSVMTRAFPADQAIPSGQTNLTFVYAGGEYFLAQICEAGHGSHREVRISKKAIELAKRNPLNTTSILASAVKH